MSRRDDPLPDTPYKGLMPYSEEDAPFFFGREGEREIITANLLASRLTLLYGASGVGKSSVLRAGVAYHLRQVAQQNLAERGTPEFAVVVFSSWRDDPLVRLADCVRDSVAQALETRFLRETGFLDPTSRSLAQTLQAWTERVGGDLLIILDQFEEYFLYHPQEDGEGTFPVEFPRAVNRPDLRASFLISIREDSLAKLDRFKGRIPNLFDNYLRIEHLDREAARAAIEKPVEQYNRLRATDGGQVSVELALVEAVLEQVRTGQVVVGEAGRGTVGASLTPTQIETPYLQLVMTRLWEEEMVAGSRTLRLETLEDRLGGAGSIVRTHLDAALSTLPEAEQDIAARVFHYLVTPSGTKIAHTVPDLAQYAELAERQVTPVLDKLSGAEVRILRPLPAGRYEIFHDVLAPAVLDWRARYVQAQERAKMRTQLARERRRVTHLRSGLSELLRQLSDYQEKLESYFRIYAVCRDIDDGCREIQGLLQVTSREPELLQDRWFWKHISNVFDHSFDRLAPILAPSVLSDFNEAVVAFDKALQEAQAHVRDALLPTQESDLKTTVTRVHQCVYTMQREARLIARQCENEIRRYISAISKRVEALLPMVVKDATG